MNDVWDIICELHFRQNQTVFQMPVFSSLGGNNADQQLHGLHDQGWVVFLPGNDGIEWTCTLTPEGQQEIKERLERDKRAAIPKAPHRCQWCGDNFGQDEQGYQQHKKECPMKPANTMGDLL